MPISTWIRDIFGIHKDIVDTEKASLEIKKLEDEERARNLITPATMDDIKEYDPKYRAIRGDMDVYRTDRRQRAPVERVLLLEAGTIWRIALFFALGALIYRFLRWLFGW